MIKIISQREKSFFIIAALVIILAMAFNYIVAPLLKTNDTYSKEISVSRSRILKYMHLVDKKSGIQKKYSKLLPGLNTRGQATDSMLLALTTIERDAKASGVKIIDLRPRQTKRSTIYKENIVDLKTSGDIVSQTKFIYGLENSLLYFEVRRLQIIQKVNSGELEANFSLSQISVE
ncbi:MAG: hypothetical protein MUF05_02780 [Candidatus Omnitrophica bacterium]|jgi:hypothetical protein|nr:hypothetical protein [Candidatus Omnitrophota bacterium]